MGDLVLKALMLVAIAFGLRTVYMLGYLAAQMQLHKAVFSRWLDRIDPSEPISGVQLVEYQRVRDDFQACNATDQPWWNVKALSPEWQPERGRKSTEASHAA